DLGKFTLKYPSDWDISGFQGETPVGPNYSTGKMSGQETIIRLTHSENVQNQFGMDLDLTSPQPVAGTNYSDGTVTSLKNGLLLWIHKQQDSRVAGRTGICPNVKLVM